VSLFGLLVLASCQLFSGVTDLEVDPVDASTATGDGPATFDAADAAEMTDAPGDAPGDAEPEVDANLPPATLTLVIDSVAGGTAASVSVNNVVVCASACKDTLKFTVPSGVDLSVKVVGAAGSDTHFQSPFTCKKTGSTCVTKVDGSGGTVRVRAVAANYVFVTKAKFTGNLGGLAGADIKCNAAATAAGLPGTYVAWISDSVTTASDRLGAGRGFVRTDGLPFADTVKGTAALDLVEGKVFYPITFTEEGIALASVASPTPSTDFVYTGTNAAGTYGGSSCTNWTSGAPAMFGGAGSPFAGSVAWTNLGTTAECNTSGHLYCFRKDRSVEVKPPVRPAVSRLAFASKPFLMGAGGIADADLHCSTEATAAALPGTYRALLATTTTAAAAATRFDLAVAKGGWFRADDMPVFPTPTALGTDALLPTGPLTQKADGTYIDDSGVVTLEAWTGMNNKPNAVSTTTAFSCTDWTSAVAGETATFGLGPFVNRLFTATPTAGACSAPHRYLYCLQQ
jgi:hypothetical protein